MYPDGYRFRVTENELSRRFCGAHRPGHFDGVLTVVLKLLNLVQARARLFWRKGLAATPPGPGHGRRLFLETEIIGLPGDARPRRAGPVLTQPPPGPAERQLAPELHRQLVTQRRAEDVAQVLAELGFEVDYVEDYAGRRLAAVRLGDTRLIDNVPAGARLSMQSLNVIS